MHCGDATEATEVLSSLDESSAVPRSMVGTWDDQPKRFGSNFMVVYPS